eukprot:1422673-Pyramimonas_sp.AAC.1
MASLRPPTESRLSPAAPGSLRRAASRSSEVLRAAHDGIYHVIKVLRKQPVQPAQEELAAAG